VARFLAAISAQPYMGVKMTIEMAEINGSPGVVVSAGGQVITAITTLVAGGQITDIPLIANPDKLPVVAAGRTLPL
jgi:hypothetical protein